MNPVVSIIVPCFNASKTIERAINSVIAQTFTDWELILVNDGSTDDTLERILTPADCRIKVLNQENKGASSARNHGLSVAQGIWVCFLDSDDALLPKALEMLLKAADSETDIVLGGHIPRFSPQVTMKSFPIKKIAPHWLAACTLFWQKHEKNILNYIFDNEKVDYYLNHGAPWAKLYKKSFLIKNKLKFNEKLVLHEDTLFNHSAYLKAKIVKILPFPVYCYLENPNSLTRTQNPKYIEHCIASIHQFYMIHPDCPEELAYFAAFRLLECWHNISFDSQLSVIGKLKKIKSLRNNEYIKAIANYLPLKNNAYINKIDKLDLFLIKYNLIFTLVFVMPIIKKMRRFKNLIMK